MPTTDVNGARIHYTESGQGEPVVLLHSSAGSGAQWQALGAALGPGYRVVAPDLHGYGKSGPWPGDGRLTLAAEAEAVATVAACGTEPIHLVGHSYGGTVALRFALDRPDAVRSLTLIEPVAFHLLRDGGCLEQELFREVEAVADAVRRAVLGGGYAGGMARFVDYWNGAGTWPRLRPKTRALLTRQAGKVVLDFAAALAETAPLAAYREIDVPTLVLAGQVGPWPTHVIAELLAATLPEARLRMVAGAGHMAPVTHPEAVNPLIAEHLDRHRHVAEQAA